MSHALHMQRPAKIPADISLAMDFADTHVDLTALSGTKDVKLVRGSSQPPKAPLAQLANQPRMDGPIPKNTLPQQQHSAPRMNDPIPAIPLPQQDE